MARGSASSSSTEKTFHISTFLPVFNFAWDSHCGYLPECCWPLNRSDWGVFSISPVQIINQIFGIILIFDNDTTMKCIIEIGNNQRTSLEICFSEIELVKGLGLESGRYGQPATLVMSKAKVYTDQESVFRSAFL